MKHQHFIRQRLTTARRTKRWSYTDLALMLYMTGLKVSSNTIANWESGRSEPRIGQLLRLAETLGLPLGYFFGQKNNLTSKVITQPQAPREHAEHR